MLVWYLLSFLGNLEWRHPVGSHAYELVAHEKNVGICIPKIQLGLIQTQVTVEDTAVLRSSRKTTHIEKTAKT